jgi:hypothetical protein
MKVFSIISFYIFIRLFIGEGILANPIFKMHLDTNIYQSNFKVCSTSGFYDANTAVTFLGDSRIDLVDNIAMVRLRWIITSQLMELGMCRILESVAWIRMA